MPTTFQMVPSRRPRLLHDDHGLLPYVVHHHRHHQEDLNALALVVMTWQNPIHGYFYLVVV
jgi:hypothetical protein